MIPGTYVIEFDASGDLRGVTNAVLAVSLGSFSATHTFPNYTDPKQHFTYTFDVTAAETGKLKFEFLWPFSRSVTAGPLLDNVVLTGPEGSGPVPEPTTLAIFGIGALGMAGLRRRKKR